jgi:integrase/recombinase XerD
MASENTLDPAPGGRESASGNTAGRRGARPTALPDQYAQVAAGYAAALARAPLADHTRRTYLSRARMFLAWLHADDGGRRSGGDPLTSPQARDWAVRDYRHWLLREADPKRSVRYANNALAALDDFYTRLGLGKAGVGRDDLPRTAPRALGSNAQIRWLRAVQAWPSARDKAIALTPFYAGLRIGDLVALDIDDVRLSARKGTLAVYGKGGKLREVPVHPQLRPALQNWIDERRGWPGAAAARALFLNRRGGRMSARSASSVFTAIAANAGLDDKATAHIGRHTFATTLVRAGEDLVLVAELLGHARLDTVRSYSQPTADDKHNALRHLTVDR